MKEIKYVEPKAFFPKEIRDKYFGKESLVKDNPLETDLVGEKTTKCDERIEFFGQVDTLSSYIMELTHYINNDEYLVNSLYEIVKDLSMIMAIVAGAKKEFKEEKIQFILDLITKYKASEKVLKEFVLPGKTLISSKIHIVRTITRTCERRYAPKTDFHSVRGA